MVLYLPNSMPWAYSWYFYSCGHILESRKPKVSSQEIPYCGTLPQYTACWDNAFWEIEFYRHSGNFSFQWNPLYQCRLQAHSGSSTVEQIDFNCSGLQRRCWECKREWFGYSGTQISLGEMKRLLEFRVVLILVFVDDMSPDTGLENSGCSKMELDQSTNHHIPNSFTIWQGPAFTGHELIWIVKSR